MSTSWPSVIGMMKAKASWFGQKSCALHAEDSPRDSAPGLSGRALEHATRRRTRVSAGQRAPGPRASWESLSPGRQGTERGDGVAAAACGGGDPVSDARAAVIDVLEPEPDLSDGDVVVVRDCEGVARAAAGAVVLAVDERCCEGWVLGVRHGGEDRDEWVCRGIEHRRDVGAGEGSEPNVVAVEFRERQRARCRHPSMIAADNCAQLGGARGRVPDPGQRDDSSAGERDGAPFAFAAPRGRVVLRWPPAHRAWSRSQGRSAASTAAGCSTEGK